MNQLYKGKAKYISVSTLALLSLAITLYGKAGRSQHDHFHSYLTSDTLPKKNTSTVVPSSVDSNSIRNKNNARVGNRAIIADTVVPKVDTVNFKMSKNALDAPVTYHADDSMVLDIPGKKILLYGKETRVKYQDNELVSPRIEFDQRSNLMSAYLVRDSNGKVISFPTFTQGDFKTVSDSIKFNPKTGKGITKGSYTNQGEIYVYGERIKKVDADVFYAWKGRFTTCNLDTPHFSFVSKRIKFVNKKMAYTGPVHPEVEMVPIPIVLPFGIYPLRQGRHSGVLAPTFTANEQLGLALEGLGYYKVLSERWDMVARGTIYSYGGWTAGINPRYYKRYRYQGNFAFNVQHFRDLDNAGGRNFNISWTHTADTKSRPGVQFNASVNAGSSKFNSSIPNSPVRNYQNQMNSSITYSKVWKDKPFNLSIGANHNQNTNSKLININLPDIAFNVNTVYPFRRREPIGEYKWYENLGVALNTNVKSLSSFYDTSGGFFNQLIDKFQWGASHNIPLTLSLPQIGPLQIAPSISYQEHWYQQRFRRSWNSADQKVDTTINKGFYTAREMSFGLSATTRIFGMFNFGKHARLRALRHEIRPSVSVSYKPDMNRQNWYTTQVSTAGDVARFSVYDGSIFGPFSEGKFGGLSFGLDNNIQIKVRNRKDTTEGATKKVTLLDGLSINGSYNFMADSFKLSSFSVAARTNLFDKINITANAVLDPYLTDSRGERINKLVWSRKALTLGKLVSGNVAVQSSFRGGDKKEKLNVPNQAQQLNPYTNLPLNEYEQEAAYINNNPGQFANFNIPWSISFSYSLNFYRQRKLDYSGFETNFNQNISWNGTLNLTPKWQLGMNAYYNITLHEINQLSMYITREMHCWQMAINISPVGRYRFFNISISPKSGILRDLKINRTRYFYDL
jgi:LPS-assembly protein